VFTHHPEIKECKENLYESGALYASMSGSGSTVYGIFSKEAEIKFNFPANYFVKIL
jgi:4-diphosphocytidyl-2-C-methyl-D-erythritol kinase